jgi:glycerol uptake facilitator-like aquaporin
MHALFYQYRVLPSENNELNGKITGALATLVVFADSDEVGRDRCQRFIATHDWEIEQFIKVMFMGPMQVENLNPELSIVYKRAEKFGIAACFDSWSVTKK